MPIGLKRQFLNKLHDSHMGIAKTKLMARTLVYWPRWNEDIEKLCTECNICCENQNMPANVPKFQVKAMYPGHIYGIDVADIGQVHGQHLVLVDILFMCHIWVQVEKSTIIRCNWCIKRHALWCWHPGQAHKWQCPVLHLRWIQWIHDGLVYFSYNQFT